MTRFVFILYFVSAFFNHFLKVEHVMNVLYNASNTDGLFSDTWSPEGTPQSSPSL